MPDELRVQDLTATEIAELLAEDVNQLSYEQAVALQRFIEDIGGIENAYAAVAMLGDLEEAA